MAFDPDFVLTRCKIERHFERFGSRILGKAMVCRPLKTRAIGMLTSDSELQLMLAGRDISGVQNLHTAFLQCHQLPIAISVICNEIAVDADFRRAELDPPASDEGQRNRQPRARWIEQPLFEHVEFGGDIKRIFFRALNLVVKLSNFVR